jgi:hypothetical protein
MDIGVIIHTMTIQETLRELVNKRGLRKVARELNVDHANLIRSLRSDLRLSTIQAILNLFGYEIRIVKPKKSKEGGKK